MIKQNHKLGIIVPYRNRYEHLEEFKKIIKEYFSKTDIDYELIIVEQDNAKLFNRGMLCNVGFIESQKYKCDYIAIHDVDMLPIDVDYSYADVPIHLATDNLPFESYFGGMTLFPTDVFQKINGFSNLYWGWGFEDDDLRYRCVKNNVSFAEHLTENISKDLLPIFNGVDAYATIPNIINYNRNFNIELHINLDRVVYDVNKQFDVFPILTIKGYDFKLFYNSFNRFYLQVFDKNGNYYDVYSDIVTSSYNKIKIEYNKSDKIITFCVNDKSNSIQLLNYIHNYSDTENMILGSDNELENFFKGSINEFLINQNGEVKIHYENYNIEKYRLSDNSGNRNHGEFFNVYLDNFKPFKNYYSYIPFRRKSKLLKLEHDDCGFNAGRWRDDNSRWNQLRYNNEVQTGSRDKIEDGLSTLKYHIHGKTKIDKITHLNVGI
jgi:hypothetical protein